MKQDINRSEERIKVCMHAFVADLSDRLEVKCVIRDVSRSGCRIVTSRVHELPNVIHLIVKDIDKPIRGIIVWRNNNMAGVCFEHGCSPQMRADIANLNASLQSRDEGDDVFVLGRKEGPLGYSERLKNYQSQHNVPRDGPRFTLH